MKRIASYYVLFLVAFVASAKALPASWPIADKIQEKMPQDITILFSFEDMRRRWQADPGRIEYLVVGECNAWFFPGEVPRLAVGNVGGLKQIRRKIKIATFFNAENVAVFWGVGNVTRHESKEAVEAEIDKLVQIVEDTYPTAEILVVSPYDVLAVTQLGPAYKRKVYTHLSNPVGYAELIRRVPELENFIKGDRQNIFPNSN